MRNYRSHASLLQVPNQLFYEERLEAAAPQDALLAPPAWGPLRIGSGIIMISEVVSESCLRAELLAGLVCLVWRVASIPIEAALHGMLLDRVMMCFPQHAAMSDAHLSTGAAFQIPLPASAPPCSYG